MAKKPAVNNKDPRLVSRGSVIWHKGLQRDEVVRDVSVVLHMANGEDLVYHVGLDEVELLAEQPSIPAPEEIEPERPV